MYQSMRRRRHSTFDIRRLASTSEHVRTQGYESHMKTTKLIAFTAVYRISAAPHERTVDGSILINNKNEMNFD